MTKLWIVHNDCSSLFYLIALLASYILVFQQLYFPLFAAAVHSIQDYRTSTQDFPINNLPFFFPCTSNLGLLRTKYFFLSCDLIINLNLTELNYNRRIEFGKKLNDVSTRDYQDLLLPLYLQVFSLWKDLASNS